METLKVCLSTADFPPYAQGGLARSGAELYGALIDLGLEVTLIAPVPTGFPSYEDERIASVRLPFYENRVLKYPFFNILSLKPKREGHFDIIHSLSTQHEVGLSRLATENLILTVNNTFAQQLGMPYSISGVDKLLRRGFYRYMAMWERIACNVAKKVIAISSGTKASLVDSYGIPSEKIDVIYLGVDLERFSSNEQVTQTSAFGREYLLYVGRIVPRKGIEYALHAFHRVREREGRFKFVVVGEGERSYMNSLVRLAKQLRIYDDVNFLGQVSDEELPPLYRDASLFIFPSLVEGFGLACLEAMACGTPVIASDIPGVREVVIDGSTGFLVPPRNHIELAKAILKSTTESALMRKLSHNASQRAKQFSWPKTAHEVYACYRDLA